MSRDREENVKCTNVTDRFKPVNPILNWQPYRISYSLIDARVLTYSVKTDQSAVSSQLKVISPPKTRYKFNTIFTLLLAVK